MRHNVRVNKPPAHTAGNVMGILSIVVWSSVIAFSRSLTEQLGTFTSGAIVYLAGGVLALAIMLWRYKGLAWVREMPPRYLWLCGGLFVAYEISLYLAIGTAANRQQVLEVGLINYLWIGFTFAFAVPILRKQARWTLIVGIAVALAGVAIAMLPQDYSLAELRGNLLQHDAPYALALGCAVSWGLYSNLSRKYAAHTTASAVPLFFLATGLSLLIIRLFVSEYSRFSASSLLELLYVIVFPTALGYIFWDIAMRKGNLILIASLSYGIPLASTIISSVVLQATITPNLWLACLLVIAGAAVCRFSVDD